MRFRSGEKADDFGLQGVGVLKLIDEDMSKPVLIAFPRRRIVFEQITEKLKKIVVIAGILLAFRRRVFFPNCGNDFFRARCPTEAFPNDFANRRERVAGETDGVVNYARRGCVFAFDEIGSDLLANATEERVRIVGIENRKIRANTYGGSVGS